MRHSDVKVIWIPNEKLFRVFDLGVAIHGSELNLFVFSIHLFVIEFEENF